MMKPATAIAVRIIDLSRGLRAPLTDVAEYARVRVFVTWRDHLLGSVEIANQRQPISAMRLRDAIVEEMAQPLLTLALTHHYRAAAGEAPEAETETLPADVAASIVVVTRDRPADLRACLHHLAAQQSPRHFEIIVVDNHPASGLTRPVVADFPGVVLVEEPRRGRAYALNSGFAAASSAGDILVTVDDTVTMPPGWLEKLLAPFARPGVMVATGNVFPFELETNAQQLFDSHGGLGRGMTPLVVDHDLFTQFRSAVPVWNYGAMVNAAFRATILCHPAIGMLDEALGRETPAGGGEDTYFFYKVLRAGYALAYEPAAYVWHKHQRSVPALRRRIYNDGKAHVAWQLTTLLRDHDRRALVHLAIKLPQTHAARFVRRLRGGPRRDYPLSLQLAEVAGNIAGLWALWQSRRRVKRDDGRRPPRN